MIQKVSIGIVLYRGEKYIEKCISSLLNQEFSGQHIPFEILLRDHSPHQKVQKFLEKKFPEIFSDPRIRFFSGDNLWHSGGHNFLIDQMAENSDAYICASNDMIYTPHCIDTLVTRLNTNSDYSVATGKILQWNFSGKNESEEKTAIIDSCGLKITRRHIFSDIGQGSKNTPKKFSEEKQIFGASGALFITKKSALNAIVHYTKKGKKEYFDPLLHYKNDIDLAYKFFLAGKKCLFIPTTLAYHDRQLGNAPAQSSFIKKMIYHWKHKSLWEKKSSFFGQMVIIHRYRKMHSIRTQFQMEYSFLQSALFILISSPLVLENFQKFFGKNFYSEISYKKKELQKFLNKENRKKLEKFFG